jgi:chemotaxis protein methyltransferase CheR
MRDVEGIQFLQWCLPRLRLSWSGYRKVRRQVYKHLSTRCQSLGLHSLGDYRSYLESHREEWDILDTLCWIPISRFYRDKAVFEFLEREVLSSLAQLTLAEGQRVLRCWSIGCAAGEEPYSLSFLWKLKLQAQFPLVRLFILATDIDVHAISRARRGCYPSSSLKELPETWRMQGFNHTAEGSVIKPEFQEPVTLLEQDIRQSAPAEMFHLILCRYMAFTYFDASLQRAILRQLVGRMSIGSALVVGKDERLPDGDFGLTPWSQKEGVYRRVSTAIVAP